MQSVVREEKSVRPVIHHAEKQQQLFES